MEESFYTEPEAGFTCSLDGASFSPCTSPRSYSGLAQGTHTFKVRATDQAQNVDPTPAQRIWTVDTTPPQTTITSGPAKPTNLTGASFGFSSEAGARFTCSLDGGAYSACTSPKSYSGLAQGSHTFRVKATDQAGNVDPTPAARTWRIDRTPPQTTIASGPTGRVKSTSATFGFQSSEPLSKFTCSLDGGAFSTCTSPKSYSALAQGSHTFRVRATDQAGNVDPTPAARTWTISLVPPETAITSGPTGTVRTHKATFRFHSSEQGSKFLCSLDGAGFKACSPPKTYTVPTGSHTLRVRAVDRAGNADRTPAARHWTVK